MAGPYRHQPTGTDAVAARFRSQQRQTDAIRTAANIRNSKITGGSGLTVEADSGPFAGQAVQLVVGSEDGLSKMLFYPPTANQVQDWAANIEFSADGSYGGGELTLSSVAAPVSRFDNQPAQTGFINLTSGDGVTGLGSVGLQADTVALQLVGAGFGNPARIILGIIGSSAGIEEDATSWRMQAGDACLVFPQTTAEVRVRDFGNTVYTVIRASAFTVTSSREAKQDIQDFGWSPSDVVAAAKAQRYRYKPEHADPDRLHFGPMAEDLPDEMVDHGDPDVPGVNTADLIGVLWGAVGELVEQNKALTARVEALEQQISGSGTPQGQ